MAYTETYTNERFDMTQQAAALMSATPGYQMAHIEAVESVIEQGEGPMPSPKQLAEMAERVADLTTLVLTRTEARLLREAIGNAQELVLRSADEYERRCDQARDDDRKALLIALVQIKIRKVEELRKLLVKIS